MEMLKRVLHIFFIIIGGTIGYLYGPSVIKLINPSEIAWFESEILGSILGAIILFLISYLIVDYIVGFLRWIEDALIRVPVGDLFFGSLGLIIGLLIAYLINLSVKDIKLQLISQIVPLFLTVILGYLGFQVGFRRREEFSSLINLNRKEKEKRKPIEERDRKSTRLNSSHVSISYAV